MPTYVYRCDNCENTWEAVHTVAQRYDEKCPGCKAPAQLQIPFGQQQISQFKPFVEHNLDHNPIEIRTARQLDREMAKRDLFKVPVKREV